MKWKSSGEFENPEPGSWPARCIWLVDLGTQQHSFQGHEPWESRDVKIVFELPGQKMTGKFNPEVKGKPFAVSTVVKQSLHPSSKLAKLLTGWRGKALSAEEVQKFDPKTLLGKVVRLNLVESEDGKFVNIESAAKLSADEAKKVPKQINPSIYFSLDPDDMKEKEFSATFAKLPENLRKKISLSPEFKAIMGEGGSEEAQPDAQEGDQGGGEGDPF